MDEPVHTWLVAPAPTPSDPPASAATPVPVASVPLLVLVHGGPQASVDDHWHYRWNPMIYAAQGFAVLAVNFHGSTGTADYFSSMDFATECTFYLVSAITSYFDGAS
jgi:dipeptidyl aminopeptidase/acylaminoacyl peptidase